MSIDRTTVNNAVEAIVEYLIDNGKSTAEKLQDAIADRVEIKPGTMNEVYEVAINLIDEEVIVDVNGVTLID